MDWMIGVRFPTEARIFSYPPRHDALESIQLPIQWLQRAFF